MSRESNPPLIDVVLAGETQDEAVEIAAGVYRSADISNSYLVTTSAESVLVNAGSAGARHRDRFGRVSSAPIRFIFITQSHGDHYGGIPELRTPNTETVAHEKLVETLSWKARLTPYFEPRTMKFWASVLNKRVSGSARLSRTTLEPDIVVGDHATFEVGDRRFETIHTPDGETVDSMCVWMPHERIVFTGNTFGPMFLSQPFLVTLRGDRPRFVEDYLRSVDRVRDLGAEILITGHGDPIVGTETVRTGLTKMRDAVAYIRDYTVAGMNAGTDVYTLMRQLQLPPELELAESHGKASWNVRSIWEGYAGWFHACSTTELYGVPREAVETDLLELAGVDSVAERALAKANDGASLEAIHLAEIVLRAEPDNRPALTASLHAHKALLDAGGQQNLSETMWLKSEIGSLEQKLGDS